MYIIKIGKVSQKTQGFLLGFGFEIPRRNLFVVPYLPPRPPSDRSKED